MNKAKIVSVIVIILLVIALSVFMGKQAFKLFEASVSSGETTQTAQTETPADTDSGDVSGLELAPPENIPAPSYPKVEPVPEESYQSSSDPFASMAGIQITATDDVKADAPTLNDLSNEPPALQIPEQRPEPVKEEPVVKKLETKTAEKKEEKIYVFANGSGINVRAGNSTRNRRLFQVGKGTKGTVIERKGGWTHILWDFNKREGWVRDDLLKFSNSGASGSVSSSKVAPVEVAPEDIVAVAVAKPANVAETTSVYVEGSELPKEGVINAETYANIRSLPSTSGEKLARLPKGMIVKIAGVKDQGRWKWFKIKFNGGRKIGWTREDNLKFQ